MRVKSGRSAVSWCQQLLISCSSWFCASSSPIMHFRHGRYGTFCRRHTRAIISVQDAAQHVATAADSATFGLLYCNVEAIAKEADETLFFKMQCKQQCLNLTLPPLKPNTHGLRPSGHSYELPECRFQFRKNSCNVRCLYRYDTVSRVVNVPISTYVISETSLSSQSLALVLRRILTEFYYRRIGVNV